MWFEKNKFEKLDEGLFKNPTSEYRGTPFWGWNGTLDKKELTEQIQILKQMGFGGFVMHPRAGMTDVYLGDSFMSCVSACVEKAKKEGMKAWIYDEDRWPSGYAGGYVTKVPEYRQRYLLFTTSYQTDIEEKRKAIKEGKGYFIACYDIVLNENNELLSYDIIDADEKAKGIKWYAYVMPNYTLERFNNLPYADTMNKEAVDYFLQVTYERYRSVVGEDFGAAIPAIFTDEPQYARKMLLPFASDLKEVHLPWTHDFDKTFYAKYGFDLIPRLPECIWELPEDRKSKARYNYHNHAADRITEAYLKNCGQWCVKNNIRLTGHIVEETSLYSQTASAGDVMRAYPNFSIPGIDMLCNAVDYTTAKQAQSVVHQENKEGMMSELYGVMNWNIDFRLHKFQGDWQAALGVTNRVHSVSLVSLKDIGKQDYPASLNYHSPWYQEYSQVENHFARLNTALTRGKPVVDVAVLHPLESYWIFWGPNDQTGSIRSQLQENLDNVVEWLLFGLIDFNFINEALLTGQCKKINNRMSVGVMQYSTIIVPGCITMRDTTLEFLNEFKNSGGKLIFMGKCPEYVGAKKTNKIYSLYKESVQIQFERYELQQALKKEKKLEIKNIDGTDTNNFIYTWRRDNDCEWLFLAHGKMRENALEGQKTIIRLKGEYIPTVYNTERGEILPVSYTQKDGVTIIPYCFYETDSLLLKLECGCGELSEENNIRNTLVKTLDFKDTVVCEREEANVCLLDLAEYKMEEENFHSEEEILRIDGILRKRLGFQSLGVYGIQPWIIEHEEMHFVDLKFEIFSEEVQEAEFAAEELNALFINGAEVVLNKTGYYIDKAISTFELPNLKKGRNELIARVPIGKKISLQNCYLIGDFDVCCTGCRKTISPKRKMIGFGSVVSQGMPFYAGNLIYSLEFETEDCDIEIQISHFKGVLIKVLIDGKDCGNIAYAPYIAKIQGINEGKHKLEVKLYGDRFNTLGALHNCGDSSWAGPNLWYTEGTSWSYEYQLKDFGILKSPIIRVICGEKSQ